MPVELLLLYGVVLCAYAWLWRTEDEWREQEEWMRRRSAIAEIGEKDE